MVMSLKASKAGGGLLQGRCFRVVSRLPGIIIVGGPGGPGGGGGLIPYPGPGLGGGGGRGSGIGHICIEIDHPGSMIASQIIGRIISPPGPMRS